MTFIDGAGKRSSTETAYLTHEVLARPNLSVLTGAHVTRILLQRSVMDGHKRVSGVEFAHGPERRRYRVRALREVVLSAGAGERDPIARVVNVDPILSTYTPHSHAEVSMELAL
jgi:choline dehydrogenase